jgi:hypothetical protein
VEEDDRRALALVEVREAQPLDLAVPGLEREIREPLEALLGGALGNALASPIHTPGVSWR